MSVIFQKVVTMKNKELSDRDKILLGMDKVKGNLLAFKKRMNSELVVLQKGKIIKIKPE